MLAKDGIIWITFENFSPSIQGTWKYIFSEWFPNSGYEFMENGVDFKLYDERSQGETGKVIEIFVPVVKKRTCF